MSPAPSPPRTSLPSPRAASDPVPAAALLDAVPDAAAVVDLDGRIVAANRAWRMFALDNGGRPEDTCEGVSYLDVCERAAASGCAEAAHVAEGLRAVLRGETVESDLEYGCPSPSVGRWFMLRITPITGAAPGALVTHLNITRRKAAEADLTRRASHDPLTGLANRRLLAERLTRALSPRAGRAPVPDVGVLCVDLDGFKPVNDRYGHPAGDEVLQEVAHRLSEAVRPQDTVARTGGDEFVVVAPRITADGLDGLVVRLRTVLDRPHVVHGVPVHVGASVGSTLARPGDDPADVLWRADRAMYAVKHGGSR